MGDRAGLRDHAVDADGDQGRSIAKDRRPERTAGVEFDIPAGQADGQFHARRVVGIGAVEIDFGIDPVGQGEFDAIAPIHLPAALAQVSRRVTTRLKTGCAGEWSWRSATK